MTTRLPLRSAAVAMAWVLAMAAPVYSQTTDGLAKAKTLYASAAYEDALKALTELKANPTPAEAREAATYKVFCLVALGRDGEAKGAIEALVRIDPLFHPSETEASPRMRAFFEDVRRPLLNGIVKDAYNKAKDDFQAKDMSVAASEFTRVIVLLDEVGPALGQDGNDMRTLAAGFRDLARAAVAPPAPATPPPAPAPTSPEPATGNAASPKTTPAASPAASSANPPRLYGADDAGVNVPKPISRPLPNWVPANTFEEKQHFVGTLELIIDENGKVTAARMVKSVRPSYDSVLLKAAQGWTFLPARKDGQPVRFLYRMEVQVGKQP